MELKKFTFLFVLSLIILIGGWGYNSSKSFAGKLYPLEGHSFELTQLDTEGNQILKISVDIDGYFYKEVISGPDTGNFELWDGENFYRYINEYNELMIVKSPKEEGKVVAHPFLSEVINNEVQSDLNNGQLKKQLFGKSYSKKYSKDKNEILEKIEFNNDINHPEKYELEINGQTESSIEVDKVKKFNKTIEAINYFNIDELKKQGTKIIEVDLSTN